MTPPVVLIEMPCCTSASLELATTHRGCSTGWCGLWEEQEAGQPRTHACKWLRGMPFRDRRRERSIARTRHRIDRAAACCHSRGTWLRQFRYTPMRGAAWRSIRKITFLPGKNAVLCAMRQDFFLW